MPRQITKNPLNMLGGLGGGGGGYSNGSTSGPPGGFGNIGGGERGLVGGLGGERGLGNIGSSERGGGMERGFSGERGGFDRGMKEAKAGQGSNGSGYTTDGYGMGSMGARRPEGGGFSNSFNGNGNNGMYGEGGGMRGGREEGGMSRDGMRSMQGRDMMRSNSDLMSRERERLPESMMRGGPSEMMGGIGDRMGGMMGGSRDMMRSQSEVMRPDMLERDGYSRDMMGREGMMSRDMLARERELLTRDNLIPRERERLPESMMRGGPQETMRPQESMMRGGPSDTMRGGPSDTMMRGGPSDTMRPQESMMRGGPSEMAQRNGASGDMMRRPEESMMRRPEESMMRSMSVSNGSGGGSFGGMGGGPSMGGGQDGGFNRSMSYHGNSASPPLGDAGLKIGTWNEGRGGGSMARGGGEMARGGGDMGRGGGDMGRGGGDMGRFGGGMEGNGGGSNGSGGFPAVSNFEIGTFNMNDPSSRSNGYGGGMGGGPNTQSNNGPIQPGMGIRETGIIEKLLHSYGFIQCCDRQARLFFHFSQFDGNIEHLKIGDPVEFEMTYDRRTGKPIASAVSKIAPEVVMSEERVIGTVTTEVKISPDGAEMPGRISYENRGECFFLPFNIVDVEGNVTLASGEKVSFQMATVQRSGNLAAKTIRLENPAAPVKYQGVVNSLKDSYGFIERADVVKEIVFNTSEQGEGREEDNSHIQLGDDVEFNIQTRNGKEVASNLTKLSSGTVVFEDVGTDYYTGQVLKPLDRTGKYQHQDPLPGRVKYRAADRSEAEIPFGEKDQVGDFTLRHGDWIKFVVAVDRRDKLKRATRIELLDESFKVSDERREQGVVQALKEGFGFLKCVDRSDKMFFHFSECLDVARKLAAGDEVEFTVAPDPANPARQLATRIKHLAANSVKFDIVIAQNILGLLTEEPAAASWPRSPAKGGESPSRAEGAGKIVYELNGLQLSIPLFATDCDMRATPRVNDKVQFNINQLKATKETNAVNIRIIERAAPVERAEPSSPPREKKESQGRLGTPQRGYVAALKDGFGFIETLQHDKEIFFHFSNVEGKAEKLEVGQEVEYSIYSREKGGKVSAEGVKPLSKGAIPKPACKEDVLNGKVVRPLRSVNPDQADYCGLIVAKSEDGTVLGEYEFGIASLLNKKELLQEGDPVNFQVGFVFLLHFICLIICDCET